MESAGVPVVRRQRGERRRGSIKSRIVELSKVRAISGYLRGLKSSDLSADISLTDHF